MNPILSLKSMTQNIFQSQRIDPETLSMTFYNIQANIKRAHDEYYSLKHMTEMTLCAVHGSGEFLWRKDLSGRYQFASLGIISRLLLPHKNEHSYLDASQLVFGRTDQQIAAEYADSGNIHSTFLSTLPIADQYVLEVQKRSVFYETGDVCGKPVLIRTTRTPAYDQHGNLFGTVGVGTEWTSDYDDRFADIRGKATELHPTVFLLCTPFNDDRFQLT